MSKKFKSMHIVLDWNLWDSQINNPPTKPGLYLFTLANFNDMPFYIGTAVGTNGLKQRLSTYKSAFANGEKSYITGFENAGDKTDFKSLWLCLKKQMYIPPLKDFIPTPPGLQFWEKELRKYYADISDLAQDDISLIAKDIEARLQQSVRTQLNLNEQNYEIKKPSLYLGQSTPNGSTSGRKISSISKVLNDPILNLLSCD